MPAVSAGASTEDGASGGAPLCWACGVILALPIDASGKCAPKFRCGWCGAISTKQDTAFRVDPDAPALHGRKPVVGQLFSAMKRFCGCAGGRVQGDHKRTKLRRCMACTKECGLVAFRGFNVFMFVVVVALIGSIVVVGYWTIFPVLNLTFDRTKGVSYENTCFVFHLIVSSWLTFNVSYHYLLASFSNPGKGPDIPALRRWGARQSPITFEDGREMTQRSDTDVRAGVFTNFQLCQRCECAKPPGAHHCSTCGRCVMDMDHHCPFVCTCVGLDNLRVFLLFLVYAVLGTGYVLLMCMTVLHYRGDEAADVMRYTRRGYWSIHSQWAVGTPRYGDDFAEDDGVPPEKLATALGLRSLGAILWGLLKSIGAHLRATEMSIGFLLTSDMTPGWFMPITYLIIAAGAVCVAVGVLMQSQMKYLWYGVPYVDFLQRGFDDATAPGWHQVRKVFGNGPMWLWGVPRWPGHVARGARSSRMFYSSDLKFE